MWEHPNAVPSDFGWRAGYEVSTGHSSPRLCWLPPPWWKVWLESEGRDPEPGVSQVFSQAQWQLLPCCGTGLGLKWLEQEPEVAGILPGVMSVSTLVRGQVRAPGEGEAFLSSLPFSLLHACTQLIAMVISILVGSSARTRAQHGMGWAALAGQQEHEEICYLLPLCWDWEQGRLCMHPLRAGSQFLTALQ